MSLSLTPPMSESTHLFVMRGYGKIRVKPCTTSFGFQISSSDPLPHPSLLFTLRSEDCERPVEFGVRLNLGTGEITDVANDSGIIGWLDRDLWPQTDPDYPLMLRWEIEHTGIALIPRLIIGDEEWLYPSVLSPGEAHFTASAGHDLEGADSSALFSTGYVWCQDRLM